MMDRERKKLPSCDFYFYFLTILFHSIKKIRFSGKLIYFMKTYACLLPETNL
jgi:hypothetical protein